ncbi:MAG: response regulator [Candidatus Omnitrophica bacterium]|nr:response regulator [Candidatus Omnitrophota bacterium]
MAKILVVDDDTRVLEATGEVLKAYGFEPILMNSPEKAVGTLKQNPTAYDLILMDWKLRCPLDGDMVIKLINHIFPDFKTPIIFITAHTHLSSKYLMRLGAYDTLTKPVAPDLLIDACQRALGLKPSENPHPKAPADLNSEELKKHEMAKRIIDAISESRSLTDAAARLGCSRRSLYRWLSKTGLDTFVVDKEQGYKLT